MEDVVMHNDYIVYKPSQWATVAYQMFGTLRKFSGRVEFDNVFSNPPDVWLRNSSSGTEVRTVPYYYPALIQYYDPFGSKSIKVLSVDEQGFTFEMKYWRIDFFKPGNLYAGTVPVPNLNNIHIDYTAVGDEGDPPPTSPNRFH